VNKLCAENLDELKSEEIPKGHENKLTRYFQLTLLTYFTKHEASSTYANNFLNLAL